MQWAIPGEREFPVLIGIKSEARESWELPQQIGVKGGVMVLDDPQGSFWMGREPAALRRDCGLGYSFSTNWTFLSQPGHTELLTISPQGQDHRPPVVIFNN